MPDEEDQNSHDIVGQSLSQSHSPGGVIHIPDRESFPSRPTHYPQNDPVNHPKHYTSHPSGVECITVTEHMNFNLGNAMKYIWRAGDKGNMIEDLKKAQWYLTREIVRIGGK